VTSSVAGFEAAIWVKSMYIEIHDLKPEKKIKYGNRRKFYKNLHLIDSLGMELTVC